MTSHLANDVIINRVLQKNSPVKNKIKQLQQFLKSDHWLWIYCILSHPVEK